MQMKVSKLKVHWSFALLGILMTIYGKFSTFLCCILCVLLHEMGHSFVGKKLGYKLNIITLSPYGAMLSGDNAPFSEADEIKIAIAGPLVNVFLILLSTILWLCFPPLYQFFRQFAIANAFIFCFNLLPVYPLDGGRVLRAVLSQRIGKARSKKIVSVCGYIITAIMFALFIISFFFQLNYMLGINTLFLLLNVMDTKKTDCFYEKLDELSHFKAQMHGSKVICLGPETPIFVAYKQIQQKNASKIEVVGNNCVLKTLSKNQILSKVLSLPIDTPLKDV